MNEPLHINRLPATLLDRILADAQSLAPDSIAILATGSYAAGTATATSDLDLMVLLDSESAGGYRTWFAERPQLPLHVSVNVASLTRWLEEREEPAHWSLGFPTDEAVEIVWATDGALERIGMQRIRRRAGEPQLEDFFEGAAKARRALTHTDLPGARWHARAMAELAPGLLIPLNPERRISDRRDALQAAIELAIAPMHYAHDLAVCLGVAVSDDATFERSALRLPLEMLAFLREHNPDVDPQPWIGRYLADGTLERHLEAVPAHVGE